jgi:hypothetical protein
VQEAVARVGGNWLAITARLFRPGSEAVTVARAAALLLQTLDPPPAVAPPAEPPPALIARLGLLLAGFAGGRATRPHPGQAAVLRCAAGNPFRRTRFRRDWRTSSVLAVAAGVAADGGYDRLPILADALQDAGCDDDHLLAHLRTDLTHVRGCWVLDRILNPTAR